MTWNMEENIPYLKHEGNQFSVSSKETFDLRSASEVGLRDEGREGLRDT